MALYSARTQISSAPGVPRRSVRISPRPGAAIQNARPTQSFIWEPQERVRRNDDIKLSHFYALKAAACFTAIMLVALGQWRSHHPFTRLGPANQITTVRALFVSLVAGCIGEALTSSVAAGAVAASMTATVLDGLDGWLA